MKQRCDDLTILSSENILTIENILSSKNIPVENNLVKEIRMRLLPILSLCYFLNFTNRVNLGNAKNNFSHDNNIREDEFTIGIFIFFIGYILFEVPFTFLVNIFGANICLACTTFMWGVCSLSMAFVVNANGLYACRFFLGLCEAGFFPGVIFYLTLWFTSKDRAFSISLLYGAAPISGMVSGFVAFGVFQLEGIGGLHGWQYLFFVEATPTILISFFIFKYLPTNPQASWQNGGEIGNYLKKRLEKFNGKAEFKISWDKIKKLLKKKRIYVLCIMNMAVLTQVYTVAFFMVTMISNLGFPPAISNAISIPVWAITYITILVAAYSSDKHKDRAWHLIILNCFACIFWILLGFDKFFNYIYQICILTMLSASTFSSVTITVVWMTEIVKYKEGNQLALATALVVSFGNVGGIVGPSIFGMFYSYTLSYAPAAWVLSSFPLMVILGGICLWCFRKKKESNQKCHVNNDTVLVVQETSEKVSEGNDSVEMFNLAREDNSSEEVRFQKTLSSRERYTSKQQREQDSNSGKGKGKEDEDSSKGKEKEEEIIIIS